MCFILSETFNYFWNHLFSEAGPSNASDQRLYYDKLSPNVCVSSEIAAIMLHCVLA